MNHNVIKQSPLWLWLDMAVVTLAVTTFFTFSQYMAVNGNCQKVEKAIMLHKCSFG